MAKKPKMPPGTWVEAKIIKSRAFMHLRGFAPQLLIFVLWKRKMAIVGRRKGKEKYECTNKDSLNVTYAEMSRYGITQPRLTRAIDQLLEKGFLSLIHQGGGYKKDKSIFSLSHKWELWSPGVCFEKRPDDVSRGFRKPKNNIRNRNHTLIRNRNHNNAFSATKP